MWHALLAQIWIRSWAQFGFYSNFKLISSLKNQNSISPSPYVQILLFLVTKNNQNSISPKLFRSKNYEITSKKSTHQGFPIVVPRRAHPNFPKIYIFFKKNCWNFFDKIVQYSITHGPWVSTLWNHFLAPPPIPYGLRDKNKQTTFLIDRYMWEQWVLLLRFCDIAKVTIINSQFNQIWLLNI